MIESPADCEGIESLQGDRDLRVFHQAVANQM